MNGLVIVLISIVALGAGYLLYGRWLARKWGIDENAQTPAKKFEDGQDFVPSSKFTVFSHQFSSIAGAGPVTGPILASVFGWVPVLLWLIVGGLFFGAVQDFGALYASVKNEGKSMGMIIEKYIGKAGRKLFMLAVYFVSHCRLYGYGRRYFRRKGSKRPYTGICLCTFFCSIYFNAFHLSGSSFWSASEKSRRYAGVVKSSGSNCNARSNVCDWYETSNVCN